MASETGDDDFHGYLRRQQVRLEMQRSRLTSYLVESKDLNKKLSIERQITDVDFRLAAMVQKTNISYFTFWESVSKMVNKIAEKENLQHRYYMLAEPVRVSPRVRRIWDEEKKHN